MQRTLEIAKVINKVKLSDKKADLLTGETIIPRALPRWTD